MEDCVKSFQFVKENREAEKKSSLFLIIGQIIKKIDDITKLPEIPEIQDFRKQAASFTETLNTLRVNQNAVSGTSEYQDLRDELDAAIRTVCTDFETTVGEKVNVEVEKILSRLGDEYNSLSEEQKAIIQTIISKYTISHNEDTVDQLRDMINVYIGFTMTGIHEIPNAVNRFTIQNEEEKAKKNPTPVPQPEEDPGKKTPKPKPLPIKHTIKRVLTSRFEVQEVIDSLNSHLADVDSGSSIELSLTE